MLYYILYLASFLVAEIFILLFWNWYVRIHTMGKMSGLKNPGTYVVVILGTIIGNSSIGVISAEALRPCRESHTPTALFADYYLSFPRFQILRQKADTNSTAILCLDLPMIKFV